jgi:hypothetical protein
MRIPPPIPKLVIAGLLSAIAVLGVTGVLRIALPALAGSETKVAQLPNVSGNCNNFGNYNVNCNTFN